jgi:hypothetical protein
MKHGGAPPTSSLREGSPPSSLLDRWWSRSESPAIRSYAQVKDRTQMGSEQRTETASASQTQNTNNHTGAEANR